MPVQFKRSSALNALNLTPLIDVVFLLLIFFILTSRFAQQDLEMDVQLPTATEAQPMVMEPKEIFLHVDEEGHFYVGRQPFAPNELETHLSHLALQNPTSQTVVLRADRRCSWDHVSLAIDLCHKAGIHDIRLPAQPDAS